MKEDKKVTKKISRKKEVVDIPWTTTVDNLCPRSDKYLQEVADDLREWCHREDVVKVTEFSTHRKTYSKVIDDWRARYPPLQEAYEYALKTIGDRREKFGLLNKYNAGLVERTMPLYNPEYKEFLKWKAEINKPTQVNNETKIVVVDRYPSTDAVPEKK